MTPTQQLIAQMRPEEPGTAGHKTCGHDHQAYGLRPRTGRLTSLLAAILATACGLLAPATAGAWSPATAIYGGAQPAPLAIAGDPEGNGVAVLSGATADAPLLLSLRDAVARIPDGVAYAWNAPSPFPGGVDSFTTSTVHAQGAGAAAAGEGAAAVVVRYRADGTDRFAALVRDAIDVFPATPSTIVPANFDRLSDPVVAISEAGTTVIGFDATRQLGRRVGYAARMSGNEFGSARVISLTGAGPIATAVGPHEAGLVAWTRAGRAEMSVLDDRGRAGKYRVIAPAAGSGEIAAAGGRRGAIVAWESTRGAVRVIRRGTSSTLRFGRPLTARSANGADLSGMTAALDANGIAYIAWREGSGSKTRILVARAKAGRRFKVDQVAVGAGLGKPSITARPIGGSIVGYAAATGWQARKIPTSGGLPIQSTVSAPGTSTAVPLARPFLSAGPGSHADMVWLQASESAPGYDVMQSTEVDP